MKLAFTVALLLATQLSALAAEPAAEPKPPLASGTLEKLDLAHHRFTLTSTNGPQTFVITDQTFIYRGKEKISPDKLKPGELIKLRYATEKNGQIVARVIKVAVSP